MTDVTIPHRACAATLLLDPAGRVLLVRQAYGNRLWGLPGGIVDAGETPVDAAIREAREEVGLDVTVDALVGMYLLRGGAAGRTSSRMCFSRGWTIARPRSWMGMRSNASSGATSRISRRFCCPTRRPRWKTGRAGGAAWSGW